MAIHVAIVSQILQASLTSFHLNKSFRTTVGTTVAVVQSIYPETYSNAIRNGTLEQSTFMRIVILGCNLYENEYRGRTQISSFTYLNICTSKGAIHIETIAGMIGPQF